MGQRRDTRSYNASGRTAGARHWQDIHVVIHDGDVLTVLSTPSKPTNNSLIVICSVCLGETNQNPALISISSVKPLQC